MWYGIYRGLDLHFPEAKWYEAFMHVSFGHQYIVISEMTSHFNPSQDLKLGKALKLDDAIVWKCGEFQKISVESKFKGQCEATNWIQGDL